MEGGFIPTAVTSLKVITPVIAQLANSETATSARRKARETKWKEGKTEQDILSRISAPGEELLLIRLAFVWSSEAQ